MKNNYQTKTAYKERLKSFTLIELLVILAIIGVLITLLLPSLKKARQSSIRAVCLSNLSQLSKAYTTYSIENNHHLISPNTTRNTGWIWGSSWNFDRNVEQSLLWPYLKSKGVYKCPNETRAERLDNGNYKRSYSVNILLNRITTMHVQSPSNTFKFLDEEDNRGYNHGGYVTGNTTRWSDWPATNHGSKLIPLNFFDGHCKNYVIRDKTLNNINSFFSMDAYRDRLKFIDMRNPLN